MLCFKCGPQTELNDPTAFRPLGYEDQFGGADNSIDQRWLYLLTLNVTTPRINVFDLGGGTRGGFDISKAVGTIPSWMGLDIYLDLDFDFDFNCFRVTMHVTNPNRTEHRECRHPEFVPIRTLAFAYAVWYERG